MRSFHSKHQNHKMEARDGHNISHGYIDLTRAFVKPSPSFINPDTGWAYVRRQIDIQTTVIVGWTSIRCLPN